MVWIALFQRERSAIKMLMDLGVPVNWFLSGRDPQLNERIYVFEVMEKDYEAVKSLLEDAGFPCRRLQEVWKK